MDFNVMINVKLLKVTNEDSKEVRKNIQLRFKTAADLWHQA